jgi:hypothetical protein
MRDPMPVRPGLLLLLGAVAAATAVAAAVACSGVPSADASTTPPSDRGSAHAVEARVQELGGRDLWPGFDPLAVPLAIHDGARTWLFRHPAPPEGFRPIEGGHVWEGRHPAVTANTSTSIGDVETAVLMATTLERSVHAAAGTAIHEAFHAFQRQRHPGWVADEMDFFGYPVTDAEALARRRLESEALRRALDAGEDAASACWARVALDLRHERYGMMPPGAATYERGNELNEGLAVYVERRAAPPAAPLSTFPDFPPEAVRLRAYPVGAALAQLLDRFAPGWRHTLEVNDTHSLDRLLAAALPRPRPRNGDRCGFETGERDSAEADARRDAAAVEHGRAEARQAFLDQPGWRLAIHAPDAAFNARFDPHNLQVVGPGEILHRRIVILVGPAGTMEVMDRSALTTGAGTHPLVDGVASVLLTGLARAPTIDVADGTLTITADGVRAVLHGARVTVGDDMVTVSLSTAHPVSPTNPDRSRP